MAITETRNLPAQFIEDLGKDYAGQLTAATAASQALPTATYAPTVTPQTALQQQATTLAGAGVGAYAPYVTAAGAAGTTAGGILGTAGTQLQAAQTGLGGIGAQYADPAVAGLQGAQTTLGGVSPYISAAGTGLAGAGTAMAGVSPYITGAAGLTGAGGGTGTGTIADYMSPYQSQVIDTTLEEFDKQAAMRQQAISDAAVGIGGYGGGREGVMQSEYQTQSDKNRAFVEAQLQQQGFGQAQAARQADMAAQLGIGGAQQQYAQGLAGMAQGQLGLGQATGALAQQQGALAQGYLAPGQFAAGVLGQQAGMAGQRAGLGQAQLGLGQYELGQAGALQGFQGADISTVGRVGAADQAQAQAEADALREANRMAAYEPLERLGIFSQGVMGLMGGYPAQYQFTQQPNASPLAQALGTAVGLGGLYGKR